MAIKMCRELEGLTQRTGECFPPGENQLANIVHNAKEALQHMATEEKNCDPFEKFIQCLPLDYQIRWEDAELKDSKKAETLRAVAEKLKKASVRLSY
ncbi:hypothetical protein PQX77_016946 [Marasmius sp. AFHP31]|nr:hypothetical protein PQX77_016946 [Marasmius sp. AFHP31]